MTGAVNTDHGTRTVRVGRQGGGGHPWRLRKVGCILGDVDEIRVRSVVLDDARGADRLLRVTWHPASSTMVFSHWSGPVCTASTPVALPDASRIIDLMVSALRDGVERPPAGAPALPAASPRWKDRLVEALGPPLGAVLRLPGRVGSVRRGRRSG